MENHSAVRAVRRQDREIDEQEARKILLKGQFGVLSTVGPDGDPYGVPISYVYRDGEIYIHSAPEGRKVENLSPGARASFCVVGDTEVQPEMFSTRYESAIAACEVRELFDQDKTRALEWLIEKFSADFQKEGAEYIVSSQHLTRVFALRVCHLTGKRRA
jgi:nitroimidazol reductase NimA-like FMN-containing flavoprotein (pyridoxamine 5'-phosphate oxidase superfamily)